MKIAIDLRALQIGHEYRGIGSYILNVLGRFPAIDDAHTYIIIRYSVSNPVEDFNLPFSNYSEVVMKKPDEPHGIDIITDIVKRRFVRKFGNLAKYKPDVFLQPDFQLGVPRSRRMKKYVVIYDLIPLVLRDMYLPSWRYLFSKPGLGKIPRLRIMLSAWLKERHYFRCLNKLKRADYILSISNATTNDLDKHLGIKRSKIVTIPLAPSVRSIKQKTTTPKNRTRKIQKPFLLYIGGVDERRRLSDLVHAFNLLNGRGHYFNLVLAGKELADAKDIPNPEIKNAVLTSSYCSQINFLGFASEEEKAWLMNNAFAFIYPTIYEGFGLPVLEAMQEKCPVITYRNSSLPEVAGQAAILLEQRGGVPIYHAVLSLVENPNKRQRLIDSGKKQVKKFSWDECAIRTYETITN